MKKILVIVIFIISCLLFLIIVYAGDVSEKLTYNLNRNLDVDWGEDHPKFTQQNMKVDFLGLSVKWDMFNIVFTKSQSALILNSITKIQSNKCITNISFLLNIQIEMKCDEIRIDYKSTNWVKNGETNISSNFFFERRVFDDLYDKQSNFVVNIDTTNLVINKINLGHHVIEYSFVDKGNMELMIDGEVVILTKKHEGLNIQTVDFNYFFLNRNFFNNTIKREITDV